MIHQFTVGNISKGNKTPYQRDFCTPISIAGLCAMGKTWNQPRYPLMVEQVKKMWCIYKGRNIIQPSKRKKCL